MGVKVSIKAKRNSTRKYRSPLISTALPSTTLRDRTTPVAERSRSAKVHQLSDSRNTGCKFCVLRTEIHQNMLKLFK